MGSCFWLLRPGCRRRGLATPRAAQPGLRLHACAVSACDSEPGPHCGPAGCVVYYIPARFHGGQAASANELSCGPLSSAQWKGSWWQERPEGDDMANPAGVWPNMILTSS